MQKQEVAVGHIYILHAEEWWKNILGGGEWEARWVSRFRNSANVEVIADSLLHTERKHDKSSKSLHVREYSVLQVSSHGLYQQMELAFPPFFITAKWEASVETKSAECHGNAYLKAPGQDDCRGVSAVLCSWLCLRERGVLCGEGWRGKGWLCSHSGSSLCSSVGATENLCSCFGMKTGLEPWVRNYVCAETILPSTKDNAIWKAGQLHVESIPGL